MGDYVIRVTMPSRRIYVASNLVQYDRSSNPLAKFLVQLVHRAGLIEQSQRQVAHVLRIGQINAIAAAGGHQYILAIRFQLLVRPRMPVVLRRHLRQKTVAQSQWRVAEGSQSATAQYLSIDCGAGNDDLRSFLVDALDRCALPDAQLGQPARQFMSSGNRNRAWG